MKKPASWPRILCCLALAFFLAGYNISIAAKETLLEQGTVMLLELRPVDPLSLLQGFYMALDYEAEREIVREMKELFRDEEFQERRERHLAVMRDTGDRVYEFSRLYSEGEALAPGEHLLAFKIVHGGFDRVSIGAGSYFFEEGYEELYSRASYAEFRVDEKGNSVLAQLRDDDLRVIARPEKSD
ncbi:MAG: GDYXXLXY domain-containing protein [Deltaproteobacteria bacterium]|jgi:uncharacterized membrane-anchored protein|nr:GDYXXLXY domain-containing protein [Deltaproteobacteria bacterium]